MNFTPKVYLEVSCAFTFNYCHVTKNLNEGNGGTGVEFNLLG